MTSETGRVHVLTWHPDPNSLTLAVARRIEDGVRCGGAEVTFENLAVSGFDSTYTDRDLGYYRSTLQGRPAELAPAQHTDLHSDVRRQQEILERADVLVLVFPIYWWSMPAAMKGWVDRVFTGGWTWDYERAGRRQSALSHLDVCLVPLAGLSEDAYDRHGYSHAIETQIEHGIVDYNGMRSVTWVWLWDAGNQPEEALHAAGQFADHLAVRTPAAADAP